MDTKSLDFACKADEETEGLFTGRATVFGIVDLQKDVVEKGAFSRTLQERGNQIKILANHVQEDVVGTAFLRETDEALEVDEGKLILDLPAAKDMHTRMKHGLVDGISIGYTVPDGGRKFTDDGVRIITDIDLWEISLVTFPANQLARVTSVKSELGDNPTDEQLQDLLHKYRNDFVRLNQLIDYIEEKVKPPVEPESKDDGLLLEYFNIITGGK